MTTDQKVAVVISQMPKSMGAAIILAVLLGPLGMLYATVMGGIVMMVISLLVGIFTVGFGLIFTWPICVIWAALAVRAHNKRLAAA